MQITQGNDKLEVPMGRTVGGADLVIVPTKSGMYMIEARGNVGAPPAISDQVFTDLRLAKREIEKYRVANAATMAKKANIKAGVERRAAAIELKNGQLDKTIQDDIED